MSTVKEIAAVDFTTQVEEHDGLVLVDFLRNGVALVK